jgi:hypothetical protein
MKIFKTLNSVMFCVAVLAASAAKAAVIPVADPYFNMFPGGQTATTYLNLACGSGSNLFACRFADKNVVGWTSSGTFQRGIVSGQWQTGVPVITNTFNSDPMINGTTPEPIVVRDMNATISQVVSTRAVAGSKYTLDVDLGFEKNNVDAGSVYLLIVHGNQVLHQVLATPLASYHLTQKQMQFSGNWYDFEASYTATAADAGAGIEILLSSVNHGEGFAFFGNVRLTDPPAAPEPATWAMMLVGFGGMAGAAAMRGSFRRRSAAGHLA